MMRYDMMRYDMMRFDMMRGNGRRRDHQIRHQTIGFKDRIEENQQDLNQSVNICT